MNLAAVHSTKQDSIVITFLEQLKLYIYSLVVQQIDMKRLKKVLPITFQRESETAGVQDQKLLVIYEALDELEGLLEKLSGDEAMI